MINIRPIITVQELTLCRQLADAHDWPSDDLLEFATRPTAFILIAEKYSTLVGYACIDIYKDVSDFTHTDTTTFACLNDILVSETCRGTGVGQLLMSKVYDVAREQNASYIRLHAEQNDTGLIDFYKKQGFNILCSLHSYYVENGEHAYYMEKPL